MAARPGTVETLALQIGLALRPLAERLAGSEAIALFAEMGLALPPELLAPSVVAALDEGAAAAKSLSDSIDPLSAAIDAGDSAGVVLAAAHVGDAIGALAGALGHVGAAIAALAANLPGMDAAEVAAFAQTLPSRLLGHLVVSRLEERQPGVAGLANLLGVLDIVPTPGVDAVHPPFTLRRLRLDRLGGLLLRPESLLRTLYRWGEPDFDGAALLARLATSLQLLGLPTQVDGAAPTTLASGFVTMQAEPPGLAATLHAELPGGIDLTLRLDDVWSVRLVSSAPVESGIGVTIAPPAAFTLHPPAPLDTTLSTELIARAADAAHPIVVFGQTQGSRLQADLFRFGLGVEIAWDATALEARALPRVNLAAQGAQAVLDFSGADGFVGSLTGDAPLAVPADFELRWSPVGGLQFSASAGGPQIKLPAALSVAGVTVAAVNLGLQPDASALGVEVSADLTASIGPVHAVLDRVGIASALSFPQSGGNLGVADLAIGFKPPSGIGLSVEAAGVLTGGGFLFHDAALGQYAGVMQLSLQDQLTLKAFGLIATRMPDGSRGYSLLIFITAEDFQPIPLGLGFMLQGIGGMVAIHRTFDQEVLRAGLKNDTLSTLLFPRDPVANAPALIQALAIAFPARRGSYLLGLLARIGWMTPTLVQMDLALILEFGARKRLLALGRISSMLPSRDNDLVRLNLDAMGVLDFDEGTLAVDAVLVDSRLAHKFAITGAAALRAGWGSGPGSGFVLAVGGFNPRFAPPAAVPPLERVAIALSAGANPRLTCEAYFAITANTYQYGARAQLYAAALGFSVEGDVGYDVLVVPLPLHFIADFHASVQLKHGSDNLFKVALQGVLEGPRPLRLSGTATFEIFWCDFSVRFDTTLIEGEPPPPPPAIDVLAELTRALSIAQSWSTQLGRDHTHGVSLRRLPPGTSLVLDPLGRLMVKQQVVPLNIGRDIDTFGGAPVAGARRFQLAATLNGQAQQATAAQDRFAPAQFFQMSDDDKLAAPSFEVMDAGLVFASDAVLFDRTAGAVVSAPLQYEAIVIDALSPTQAAKPRAAAALPASTYVLPALQLAAQSTRGAAALAPLRRVGRARFQNPAVAPVATLSALHWTIVPLDDGPAATVATGVQTWSDYRTALASLNRAGARWQMVPAHELVA